VVHARLALYRVLITQGWTPPESVATQVDLDAHLMTEASEHLL
jgi:transketolase N-terminal domain/subunit